MRSGLVASLALGVWPIVVLAVYAARRNTGSLARTTAWMMVLPVMFLPSNTEIKTPGVPALDKHRIAFLAIAVALQLFHRRQLLTGARWQSFPRWVLLLLVAGVYQTVRTNGDVLRFGPTVLPGLAQYDIISTCGALVLDLYLPFVVGQRVFRDERDVGELFEVLGLAALLYTPLILFELRFSPQLHNWVYGYYPSDFVQSMRGGGYRPMVFFNHGLSLSMFLFSAICGSMALHRARLAVAPIAAGQRVWGLTVLLVLCKSMGALIYALMALLTRAVLSSKAISRLLVVLALLVVLYPVTRATDIFPARDLVLFFSRVSQDRADSLAFRFQNEDDLLERAMLRPIWGWGTYGRNRIFAPWGQDISVTDGYWLIVLGGFGFVGFIGFFSLLLGPVLRFVRHRGQMGSSAQVLVGMLAFMVVIFAADLLPNARSDFLPIAYAGALYTVAGPPFRRKGAKGGGSGTAQPVAG
jgi:hypothetical protein